VDRGGAPLQAAPGSAGRGRQAGAWTVDVVGADGTTLGSVDFTVP